MSKLLLILLLSSTCVLTATSPPNFGLKDTSCGDPIQLDWVFMRAQAEGSHQQLEYFLTYNNTKDHAVDTAFYFPRDQDFILNKVEATFHDYRTVTAKIVDKEQINTGPQASSEFLSLAVGKLQANETVRILFSIIKPLKLHLNKFYEIKFPAITNQESPFIFDYDVKEWSISVHINSNTELSILTNPTHGMRLFTFGSYSAHGSTTVSTDKDFIVYFAPNKNSIIQQTHPIHNMFTSLYPFEMISAVHPDNPSDHGFFLSFVPDMKYFSDFYVQNTLKNPNGLFELQKDASAFEQRRRSKFDYYFLMDRSDSMKGPRFENLKKTLIALIQTLPQQSTIHLFSFGNTSGECQVKGRYPSDTRSPNVKEATEWIETLEADMGEQNLLEALEEVLRPSLEAPLIILTAEETLNSQRILNFMSKESASGFRICSLIIGNNIAKEALKEIGNAGKCWSESIAEDEDLGERVIQLVRESALKPRLYFNIELQCKDSQEQILLKKDIARGDSLPYDQAFSQWISLEDSPDLNYCELNLQYFDIDGSINERKSGRICRKERASKCVTFFEDAQKIDIYHKIEYHRRIRKNEQKLNFYWEEEEEKKQLKQKIINRSKQYQIISDFTSLVPVEHPSIYKKSNRKKRRDIDL